MILNRPVLLRVEDLAHNTSLFSLSFFILSLMIHRSATDRLFVRSRRDACERGSLPAIEHEFGSYV